MTGLAALFTLLTLFKYVVGFSTTNSILQPTRTSPIIRSSLKAADSEVSFDDLDGSDMRIGIIRTRWNEKHVSNLLSGARKALKDCKVKDENIFETNVPGSFELPIAAKFLALSGTVDAIICTGVLIKGDTMHFEYIADAVSKGLMNVGINVNLPIVFGVLTCLDENQVIARSTGDSNHGYDHGKTAVEMALLKSEAMGALGAAGKGGSESKLKKLGFGGSGDDKESSDGDGEKKVFF